MSTYIAIALFVAIVLITINHKVQSKKQEKILDKIDVDFDSARKDFINARKMYHRKEKWYKALIEEKQIQAKAREQHVKDTELHNEKLKSVNESVVDALIDRQEYVQVIEKAVETICSLCDNAPNCEGCYWKSVQDDLVLPYRNRTGIVNKDAHDKFMPPAADETDIEDYLPKLSEIEKE